MSYFDEIAINRRVQSAFDTSLFPDTYIEYTGGEAMDWQRFNHCIRVNTSGNGKNEIIGHSASHYVEEVQGTVIVECMSTNYWTSRKMADHIAAILSLFRDVQLHTLSASVINDGEIDNKRYKSRVIVPYSSFRTSERSSKINS